jgi:hypothetical protein
VTLLVIVASLAATVGIAARLTVRHGSATSLGGGG